MQATVTDHEPSRDAAGPSGATLSQVRPDKSTDGQLLQEKILEQLERVTQRLEILEGKMAASTSHSTPTQELGTDSFLESVKPSKNSVKSRNCQLIYPLKRMLRVVKNCQKNTRYKVIRPLKKVLNIVKKVSKNTLCRVIHRLMKVTLQVWSC